MLIPGVQIKDFNGLTKSINPYVAKCLVWEEISKYGGQVLYVDAGIMICGSLEALSKEVPKNVLLSIPSSFTNKYCTPKEFISKYNLDSVFLDKAELGSGFVWFNFDNPITKLIVNHTKKMALEGDVEGWSYKEQSRNRGIAKSNIVRNCHLFRHDETALNISAYIYDKNNKPLHPMRKYNHCFKLEYEDQIVYTYRRRNRAPALKFAISEVSAKQKWRYFWVIIKNIYAYFGLTLLRNYRFYRTSKVYTCLINEINKISCGRFLLIKRSDRKYKYKSELTTYIENSLVDRRRFKFDTFQVLVDTASFNATSVLSEEDLKELEINTNDIVAVDVIRISMSVITMLIEKCVPFYIRYRVLEDDVYYKQTGRVISTIKDKYRVYNAEMEDVVELYESESQMERHYSELNFHPIFHDREIIELLFIPIVSFKKGILNDAEDLRCNACL
ncbi:hypothetical protein [Hahella ganghwensis]|uniref:hypothetical protein n=1 Tax=Hahella ganghwensis TaxID=286420 RepID=UPI0012F9B828|nr:hypothetical protein [Hahella ganghwensis]